MFIKLKMTTGRYALINKNKVLFVVENHANHSETFVFLGMDEGDYIPIAMDASDVQMMLEDYHEGLSDLM